MKNALILHLQKRRLKRLTSLSMMIQEMKFQRRPKLGPKLGPAWKRIQTRLKAKRRKKRRLTLTSTRDGTRSASSKKRVACCTPSLFAPCCVNAYSAILLLHWKFLLRWKFKVREHGDAVCLVEMSVPLQASVGVRGFHGESF